MTKVLHIDSGHEMRGSQWQIFYLVCFQLKEGCYPPVVACPPSSPLAKKLREIGVEIIPFHNTWPWNPLTILRLAFACRKHKFAIIHTHDEKAASFGAKLCRMWGNKVRLVHTRSVSYPVKRGALSKYKAADTVVAVSHDTANNLRISGLLADQLCVIHSGIDLSRYQPKTVQDNERFIFVMVGALTSQKGHSVLIKAMKHLTEFNDMPPWEMRIVGDGPLFNDILTEAKELQVESYLSLLGNQDATSIIPHCDAMIVPSVDGEGSSSTIKEAWAIGLPLICSSLAANLELAESEHNAVVFICGLDKDLAEAMRRVAKNAALRKRLVASGRETVLHYTADKMALSYSRLYNRILSF